MAKRKKDDEDDELEPVEEIEDVEEESDVDELAAEDEVEPASDEDEPFAADDEPAPADDDLEPVAAPPDVPADAPDFEPEPPPLRPKTSVLNIVLLVLNLIAAGAFAYLVLLDYDVRQNWTYATFRNELALWGLPLGTEEKEPAARVTRPRLRLEHDQIKKAFATSGRGGKGADKFAPVDESQAYLITPAMISDDIKKDIFKGLGPPVTTLEEEVNRIKKLVPETITKQADAYAGELKGDKAKRDAVQKYLLPLAWNSAQVDVLAKEMETAQGQQLQDLVVDAIERRLYADVLAPINLFRPGDVEKYVVEKLADRKAYPIEKLRELFQKRCEAAIAAKYDPETHIGEKWTAADRDSVEKRQQVAFLLFASVAELRFDGMNLIPEAFKRVQTVVGIHDVTLAAAQYTHTLRILEQRVLDNIRSDRAEFVDRYKIEVEKLKELVKNIEAAEFALAELKGQRERDTKLEQERTMQLKEAMDKLASERKITAEKIAELKGFQDQLFRAELELSNAADRNFELEAGIRKAEARLRGGRP